MKSPQKTILFLFKILFFLTPLILWPFTSELFEFNKMVLVYILTTLITGAWVIRMIYSGKIIFRRTILDIPILIFLSSQLISTILSIDITTSWLGYYSRFNGGMLSLICYSLLYWAFVSNIDRKGVFKINSIILLSATFVAIYGVLERLGIDKNIWQQDVQSRVFSTLGQPNWLAAWLVALIPITWANSLANRSNNNYEKFIPYALSTLFFVVLLFTGSRSGLIGFGFASLIFWGLTFLKSKFTFLKPFIVFNVLILISAAIFGTQYTPSVYKLIQGKRMSAEPKAVQNTGTVLEFGGTESGTIRKIVWQGALDIWKRYPIFGTGVETFAYSYYFARPLAHNLTSEWDFIYNKAHNEYLNYLANSGSVGILSYLLMVGFAVYLLFKNSLKQNENEISTFLIAYTAGYLSILVTNFFGFSVVPVQLIFFLLPAFSIVLTNSGIKINDAEEIKANTSQKTGAYIVLLFAAFIIYLACRYWYADLLFAKGSNYNKVSRQDLAVTYLYKASQLEPNQSVYFAELARSYTTLALAYNEAKEATGASQLSQAAIANSLKAVELSPANVNMKRVEFGVFIMLASIDQNYLLSARDVLLEAIKQAPTDAKLHYNLGLVYSRIGENDLALETLKKTIELKPNYKDARLAYAILLMDAKKNSEAKAELEYILNKIDPNDSMSKQYLESMN